MNQYHIILTLNIDMYLFISWAATEAVVRIHEVGLFINQSGNSSHICTYTQHATYSNLCFLNIFLSCIKVECSQ